MTEAKKLISVRLSDASQKSSAHAAVGNICSGVWTLSVLPLSYAQSGPNSCAPLAHSFNFYKAFFLIKPVGMRRAPEPSVCLGRMMLSRCAWTAGAARHSQTHADHLALCPFIPLMHFYWAGLILKGA